MEAIDTSALPVWAHGESKLVEWLEASQQHKVELLDGRLIQAMPSIEHGTAAGVVMARLERFLGRPGEGGGGGWWLSMDVDLYLSGQGLRPDVVGWRIERSPQAPRKVNVGKHLGVYVTPPDWVCEVLSGSTAYRDVRGGVKWDAYHQAGVSHYWLIDLWNEGVMVFERGPRRYELAAVVGRDEAKALPPFEEMEFDPRRMFEVVAAMRGRE